MDMLLDSATTDEVVTDDNTVIDEAKTDDVEAGDDQKTDETVEEVKTEDTKTEDEKKDEDKKPEGAPEKYEFKLADGYKLDESITPEFESLAKELNLTNEEAQKLLDLDIKKMQAYTESSNKAYEQMVTEWGEETKKMLGADYQKKLAPAAKALDSIEGGKELRQLINQNGFGNHPVLTKFLINVGKLMSEDSFVKGSPKNTARSKAEILFGPDSVKKNS